MAIVLINCYLDNKDVFLKKSNPDFLVATIVKDDQLYICISAEKKKSFLKKCHENHHKPSMVIRLGIQYYVENGTFI